MLLTSCSDFLDFTPEDVVTSDENFQNVYDADAAVRGIYGKLIGLADEYVILNELRADLMDVTANANHYLREINLHEATADNPYADPSLFYSVINDCNNALMNFNIMLKDLKFSQEDYNQRYSDIAAVRSWLYLQLVIQFGKVPYITTPIDEISDIKMLKDSVFPMLTIEPMIDSLVDCMENIPYKGLYTDETMMTTLDGYNTKVMYIDKQYLLGELYLWQGDYLNSAIQFKNVMERDIGYNDYDTYKLPTDFFTDECYNSRYVRYYEHDINSVVNNWPKMFSEIQTKSYYCEWIWTMYFSEYYEPENPFIDLFAYNGGSYLLKPSDYAISNWDSQIQKNDFLGDMRGEGSSYYLVGDNPVISKFVSSYNYTSAPYNRSGNWFLWRAAGLHLKYSEAANRDGYSKVAYALMNLGIKTTYADPDATDFYYQNQTLLAFPYDFDGRQTSSSQVPPGLHGEYYRNMGVRGRVYTAALEYPEDVDSLTYTEDKILDEAALELAFEGERWGDLVRVAIHRNNPSILADRIYNKLKMAGYGEAEAVRTKLMSRENWFIPY